MPCVAVVISLVCYVPFICKCLGRCMTEYDAENDMPLATLAEFWRNFTEIDQSKNELHDDFVNLDQRLSVEESFNENDGTENNIAEAVAEDTLDMPEESDEEENKDAGPINSYASALEVVENLKKFSKLDFVAFEHLKNIESHFQNCFLQEKLKKLKQSKILDFFLKITFFVRSNVKLGVVLFCNQPKVLCTYVLLFDVTSCIMFICFPIFLHKKVT